MQFWDQIIHHAMLGTDKQPFSTTGLPDELASAVASIDANKALDKEEKFLQYVALAFNYRQAGATALHNTAAPLPLCLPEEKPYCNAAAMQVLKDIQFEEGTALLQLWLQHCAGANQVVQPAALPYLLQTAVQNSKLRALVAACGGNRGAWLSQFNEAWNFSQAQTATAQWQTGNLEQRKAVLQELRASDPALALNWVQQTWGQEDAATKVNFLEILRNNISEADLPFVEQLLQEKSKKVKDIALQLIKSIPASSVVQLYQQVLRQAITIRTEKKLLGLSSKTILHVDLPPALNPAIFDTGIEKLSNQKGYTDDEWILYQLVAAVPPSCWCEAWNMEPAKVLALFQQDIVTIKFVDALATATITFADREWAVLFTNPQDLFRPGILPLLSPAMQEEYCLRSFGLQPQAIIQFAVQRQTEWSMELALQICKYMAANPYNYNRSFFNHQIASMPVQIVDLLQRCTPKDEHLQTMWTNTSAYINKMIAIKRQIIQAFKV